jgi:glycerophosphoryl diester phosphodiesterase
MLRKMLRWLLRLIMAIVILLVVVYVGLVIRSQPMPDHPFFVDNQFLVIAHQGGDGLRPSNTMSAFENAVALGVDVLEMDIHSTQDGILVTIHDATIDRTTNGSGRVLDYTFEALQQFDAGYHFPTLAEEAHRSDKPYRGQGITIPALTEIFEAFPEMPMVIEIKQKTPSIVTPFCELLRQYQMTDQVVVATFHEDTVREFRQVCPEVPTAAVESEVRLFFVLNSIGLTPGFQPEAYAFQVPEYSGDLQVVTRSFVENAQQHNIDVHPWTINDEAGMRRLIAAGVQGIITDYPDKLLQILGR